MDEGRRLFSSLESPEKKKKVILKIFQLLGYVLVYVTILLFLLYKDLMSLSLNLWCLDYSKDIQRDK